MVIAVIDDEKPAREELAAIIHDYDSSIHICTLETAEKALEQMANDNVTTKPVNKNTTDSSGTEGAYDLAFIDINMPDMDGVTLARLMRKLKQDMGIIFATAYNNYAKEAFEVEAYGYILKPYDEQKIIKLLEKYRREHGYMSEPVVGDTVNQSSGYKTSGGGYAASDYGPTTREQESYQKLSMKLPLNIQKKTVLLDIRDIVYAEIENRNCIIHTIKGDFTCNYTMAMLEDKLRCYDFFRIQKSYLIHLKYLLEIYPWFNNTTCVKMKGFEDQVLTVGRSQVKELKNWLNS